MSVSARAMSRVAAAAMPALRVALAFERGDGPVDLEQLLPRRRALVDQRRVQRRAPRSSSRAGAPPPSPGPRSRRSGRAAGRSARRSEATCADVRALPGVEERVWAAICLRRVWRPRRRRRRVERAALRPPRPRAARCRRRAPAAALELGQLRRRPGWRRGGATTSPCSTRSPALTSSFSRMPPSRCSTVLRWLSASSTPWVTTALSRRAYIAQPPAAPNEADDRHHRDQEDRAVARSAAPSSAAVTGRPPRSGSASTRPARAGRGGASVREHLRAVAELRDRTVAQHEEPGRRGSGSTSAAPRRRRRRRGRGRSPSPRSAPPRPRRRGWSWARRAR